MTTLASSSSVAASSRLTFLPPPLIGWQLDAAMPEASCTAMLGQLAERGFERTAERYPSDYRDNDRLVFDDAALAASLFADLRARLPMELERDGVRWQLCGLNARFRACRYANGQAFCVHRDGPYAPSDDVRSLLTVQLYLDDDPARVGGRTRFYADARGEARWASVDPRRGTAIVFDHRAWHDGEAVTAGVKHVLRTDAMYRRVSESCPDDVDVIGRHRGYVWRAIERRDGSIASAGRDGTIRHWECVANDRANVELGRGSITTLIEATDGRLWCGTRAGAVMLVDELCREVATDVGAVLAADVLDNLVVVSTSRGLVVAFDAMSGAPVWRREAHDGWAWSIATHRAQALDGFLSCGTDGRVVLLDRAGRMRVLAELRVPLRAIASLPGAARHLLAPTLAVGDDRGWIHWLAGDGRVIASRRVHAAAVTSLVATADACISASEDGTVRRTIGVHTHVVHELRDFATSVALDTQDRIIVCGYDGAVRRIR